MPTSSPRRPGLRAVVATAPPAIPLVLAALFTTLLGLGFRLSHLGAKPFWLDEVTTLHRSALPFGAMVRDSLSFHHLPTWFAISSWFLGHAPDQVALRLPAALFGALSCGLASVLAGTLAGTGPALLAGMLVAASPVEVQYGQEARSYALVIFCVLLALQGLVLLLRDPARAGRPWSERPSRGAWCCYVVGTLGGLLTLGVAIWWLLIANLAVLLARGRTPLPPPFRRRWLGVQALIAAAATPGFVAMLLLVERAHGTFRSGMDWIPPLSWDHLRIGLAALYGLRVSSLITDRLFASPVPWLEILVPVLALLGAVLLARRGAERRVATALVVATVALPLLTALVSLAAPLFMPRYVLWSTGPFLVLAGIGLLVFPPRARLPAALLLGAAAVTNLLPYYRVETKPRWERAANLVALHERPGDLMLIADPGAVDMMNVFLGRRDARIDPAGWTRDTAAAVRVLRGGGRVWAVFGRIGQNDAGTLPQFLRDVAPLGVPAARFAVGLDITILLFDRPPDADRARDSSSPAWRLNGVPAADQLRPGISSSRKSRNTATRLEVRSSSGYTK